MAKGGTLGVHRRWLARLLRRAADNALGHEPPILATHAVLGYVIGEAEMSRGEKDELLEMIAEEDKRAHARWEP